MHPLQFMHSDSNGIRDTFELLEPLDEVEASVLAEIDLDLPVTRQGNLMRLGQSDAGLHPSDIIFRRFECPN